MKKVIGLLAVVGIFLIGSFSAYNYFYGGDDYYTKITTNGEKTSKIIDNGETVYAYNYEQAAYDADGNEKRISLHEERSRPLKMNAYLKLKINPRKGVISWEEVSASKVPEKAATNLDK